MSYADPYYNPRNQQYNQPYGQTGANYDPYHNYRPQEAHNQGGYQEEDYRDEPTNVPAREQYGDAGRSKEAGYNAGAYAEASRPLP